MRSVLLGLLLGLALAACSKPEPPKLTPQRATVTAISAQGLELRVELDALNPNKVDLSARSLAAKLSLDGREAGSSTVDRPISLPAGQTTKLDVPLSIQWTAASSLAALAAQGRDVPYALDGTVNLGGDLLNVDVPFHMTGTLVREELLKAAVRSLPKLPFPVPTSP